MSVDDTTGNILHGPPPAQKRPEVDPKYRTGDTVTQERLGPAGQSGQKNTLSPDGLKQLKADDRNNPPDGSQSQPIRPIRRR